MFWFGGVAFLGGKKQGDVLVVFFKTEVMFFNITFRGREDWVVLYLLHAKRKHTVTLAHVMLND